MNLWHGNPFNLSNLQLMCQAMSMVRKEPPSNEPNNQDVFIWALYILGGADADVDVEEIYLKCFEMAPARLGWRTRPEIPDYKKTSKALQSVEATTHIGLVHRPHQYSRRLTLDGIKWVESYQEILEKSYSKSAVHASKSTNVYERSRFDLHNSGAWAKFSANLEVIELADVAAALRCSPASTAATWKSRVNELRRAADVLQDDEIMKFAEMVQDKFIKDMHT